jgi:hypothetical protein
MSWSEIMINEEVYQRINEKISIWTTIEERRKKWIRYIIRNNEWITTIIEGNFKGKPGRERPRQSYIKQIMLDIRKGHIDNRRESYGIEKNRGVFHHSTKLRIEKKKTLGKSVLYIDNLI